MKNFKVGDTVKMVNCLEATIHGDKEWICRTDSFNERYGRGLEVVFLENFAGYFLCEYLEKVEK